MTYVILHKGCGDVVLVPNDAHVAVMAFFGKRLEQSFHAVEELLVCRGAGQAGTIGQNCKCKERSQTHFATNAQALGGSMPWAL